MTELYPSPGDLESRYQELIYNRVEYVNVPLAMACNEQRKPTSVEKITLLG